MALPDFVGIGTQKAGTTWLYDKLTQNPSVWLPPLKEVHYFDLLDAPDKRKAARNRHLEGLADRIEAGFDKGSDGDRDRKVAYIRSLVGDHMLTPQWYQSVFDHPDAKDRVTGEITPAYLDLPDRKLQSLIDMLPKTKFVLIIREPVARELSQLRMTYARTEIKPETVEQWQRLFEKQQNRGDYMHSIPRWRKHIAADRLLILPFGRVRDEPAELIREIEDFIGAKPFDGYKDLEEPTHTTEKVELPGWLVESIEEQAVPQRNYLIEAFGEEFYRKTR